MNKGDLDEFVRRLNAEGLSYRMTSEKSARVTAANGMSVSVENDCSLLYNNESRPLAIRIRQIYYQIQEYMPALRSAQKDTANLDWENQAQRILVFNGCELAASQFSDNNIGFITWKFDRNGERDDPCFFTDYEEAKRDFAVRAELIPRNMLFSERQLSVIRSCLSNYLALLEPSAARLQKDGIHKVIDKINTVAVPKIYDKEEEYDYEPEYEL